MYHWWFNLLRHKVIPGHVMKRGSSAVECRTRNQGSPGSNPPPGYRFEVWAFSFCPLTLQLTQLYNWVPGYTQWWKCEWFSLLRYIKTTFTFTSASTHACRPIASHDNHRMLTCPSVWSLMTQMSLMNHCDTVHYPLIAIFCSHTVIYCV